MPERQMVRGEGKRCREILPLTSIAHSVILSAFSLYFCGCMGEREGEREESMGDIWVCLQGGSSSMCALNLLHNLPAYFRALMQYCFSVFCRCLLPLSPIFHLIVIHVQSVCLANRPRIETISAEQLRVHVSLSVFPAIFCIIRVALVIHSITNAAGLLYKLKAFTAP